MAKHIGFASNIDVLRATYFQDEQHCVLIDGPRIQHRLTSCFSKRALQCSVLVEYVTDINKLRLLMEESEHLAMRVFIISFPRKSITANMKVPKNTFFVENKPNLRGRVSFNLKRGGAHFVSLTVYDDSQGSFQVEASPEPPPQAVAMPVPEPEPAPIPEPIPEPEPDPEPESFVPPSIIIAEPNVIINSNENESIEKDEEQ
jgi:hypothetical protein|tara:strand:+ start:16888 stop:17493 length:606 start_codon:yes stop_codon:yes gene_type:complete